MCGCRTGPGPTPTLPFRAHTIHTDSTPARLGARRGRGGALTDVGTGSTRLRGSVVGDGSRDQFIRFPAFFQDPAPASRVGCSQGPGRGACILVVFVPRLAAVDADGRPVPSATAAARALRRFLPDVQEVDTGT